ALEDDILMKRMAFVAATLLVSVAAAPAADDPIAQRKMLMDATAAAAGASAGMLKGEIDYNPAVANAAIMAFRAVSHTYGSFFPDGSDKGDTKASPKIWEDMAGFQERIAKFQADADAAT